MKNICIISRRGITGKNERKLNPNLEFSRLVLEISRKSNCNQGLPVKDIPLLLRESSSHYVGVGIAIDGYVIENCLAIIGGLMNAVEYERVWAVG